MRSRRVLVLAFTVWIAVWVYACGDRGTEPLPEPVRASTVTVIPASVALAALGATQQLTAEVRDQNGQVMAGVEVEWASSAPSVALVSGAGLVTAVANGTATIIATAGEASADAAVIVAQMVDEVSVSPIADTLVEGDTLRLSAQAVDANGHAVTDAGFTWASSDTTVAVVNETGLVSARGSGEVAVKAMSGGVTGEATLTVVANPDRAALVALYEATDGPNWLSNDGWLTDAPLGEWHGVAVGYPGRVTGLSLSRNGLSGRLTPELGKLTSLRRLELSHNSLSGSIPAELGGLRNLGSLRMRSNTLEGSIPPELGMLERLQFLEICDSGLTGPIPSTLGDLDEIEWLILGCGTYDSNHFSGEIPPEIGGLRNLQSLSLDGIGVTGSIPAGLSNLEKLQRLSLHGNELTGPIPSELGGLVNLSYLDLSRNRFGGSIPSSFLQLPGLSRLALTANAGLCVPGTAAFFEWSAGIGSFRGPYCHEEDASVLRALHEATGGSSWSVSDGWLGEGPLSNWTGVTTDSIGLVQSLDLQQNGLEGRLPSRLGALSGMTSLRIGGNRLAGALPRSLARLRLRELRYAGTDLCVPVESSFRTWLRQVTVHEGTGVDCAPLADHDILATLYEAAGGPQWRNRTGWLTDAPIGDWHGVAADDSGRVVRLELRFNNLEGEIPADLGHLGQLEILDLSSNSLTGRIPPELGNLANLERLSLSWNGHEGRVGLEGEIPPELGNLVSLTELDLFLNSLTGSIPAELGNLRNLRILNLPSNDLTGEIPRALGGLTNLVTLDLAYNSLVGPIPTEIAALQNLENLQLSGMSLSGSIPPELGALSSLRQLTIGGNDLEGTIPRELGQLANLEELWLNGSNLTGPIPTELGSLANLKTLALYWNELSGPIPTEAANLSRLQRLYLNHNKLTGEIPADVGRLGSLVDLALDENQLSGAIPFELGHLSSLQLLDLSDNGLAGAVPQSLGSLRELRSLHLSNNEELSGELPGSLANLAFLNSFQTSGTELCAPGDPGFLAWLDGVRSQRVRRCVSGEGQVYLTQAVQSRDFPVPLVANEPALLRVFLTSERADGATIPPVRATFYNGGVRTYTVDIPAGSSPIPTDVAEHDLTASANAEIAGEVLRPGVEMVVEIDPEGTLDPALGIRKRIPETGRTRLDVRSVPVLDITVVPFLWRTSPDSTVLDITRGLSHESDLFRDTRTLLPVEELEVTVHPVVWTSTNDVFELHDETRAIHAIEGGNGHYVGTITGNTAGGAAGVTTIGGRASFAEPESWIIAHELGHNMGLAHAPCGNPAALDWSFPYSNGSIGAWGYDSYNGEMVNPGTFDLMSYCRPRWISDYHFANALRYRLHEEDARRAAVATPARSLLLWGGIDAEGVPHLEPAFVIDAPALLPDSAGEYQLTGRTRSGGQLFSMSFAMPEMPDGDGRSGFAFVAPAEPGWEQNLASITLSGPGGTVMLDDDSDLSMAILRNSRTGRVRGILRYYPEATRAAADADAPWFADPALETLFSHGIPDASAWRR